MFYTLQIIIMMTMLFFRNKVVMSGISSAIMGVDYYVRENAF